MFCADYICSFIYHFGINYGLFHLKDVKIITKETVTTVTNQSYFIGACSGLLGALTIHKFDFVRQGAITSNKFSIIHSLCMKIVPSDTVPSVKPNELLYLLIEGTKIEDSYLTFMRNCILEGDNFRAFRVDLGGQNSKGDNFQLYHRSLCDCVFRSLLSPTKS